MPLHFLKSKSTFIHIPKNAGNSLEKWAIDNNLDFEDKHNHCTVKQAELLWEDLGTVFSFVRNPYARTVSMFHYLGQNAERKILEKSSTNLLEDIKTVKLFKKGFDYWLNCLYDKDSEFIEHKVIGEFNGHSFWPRRASQTSWLAGRKIDLIIKVEDLNNEFYKIEELLQCKSTIPLGHVNPSKHLDYRVYYNSHNKKIIEDMFSDDLHNFNYNW